MPIRCVMRVLRVVGRIYWATFPKLGLMCVGQHSGCAAMVWVDVVRSQHIVSCIGHLGSYIITVLARYGVTTLLQVSAKARSC